MKCPIDQKELVMSERQGIEIDYCPECRGVWLDRGELDKMIERAAATQNAPTEPYRPSNESYRRESNDYTSQHDSRHHDDYRKKRKKEGFLGDLFDF